MDELWRNTWRAFFGLKPRPVPDRASRDEQFHRFPSPIPPESGDEFRTGPDGTAALAHEDFGYSISARRPPPA